MDDAGALRAAIEREVGELERLCSDLEKSLVAGDWNAAGNALRSSRRATHAFLNAMDAAGAARDEAFDLAIHTRVRRVFDIREDQLARLHAFRDGIGQRLQTLSRWKSFAGAVGGKKAPAQRAGLDETS